MSELTPQLVRRLRRAPGILFALDGALVVMHLAWGQRSDLFDVHTDAGIAGWWISAQLLLMAVLAWWFSAGLRGPRRQERSVLWQAAALGFAVLSLEKIAQVHQRLARLVMQTEMGEVIRRSVTGGDPMKDSYGWVLLLLPVMAAMLYFLVVFFRDEFRHDRRTLWWWFGGLALALCHPLLEAHIYWLPPMDEWTAHTMSVHAAVFFVRRTAELAALSCLLTALLRHLRLSLERHPR